MIGNPLRVYSARHRFARRGNAGRRPVVVVAVAHRPLDRGDQVRRRLEAEGDRIADVEIPDARAGRLDLLRFRDDVADGVGEAVNASGSRDGGLRSWRWSRARFYGNSVAPVLASPKPVRTTLIA